MAGLARLESVSAGPDVHLTNQGMEPISSPAHAPAQLLSLLVEGVGRNAALSVLQRASPSRGACSLLSTPTYAGHLHATSGAGIEGLPSGSWHPDGREGARLARSFAKRVAVPVPHLSEQMPQLHDRLGTSEAILLPLENDSRRFGLLAVGMPSHAHDGAGALQGSACLPASLAPELTARREEFNGISGELLETFAATWPQRSTSRALEPLACDPVSPLTGRRSAYERSRDRSAARPSDACTRRPLNL